MGSSDGGVVPVPGWTTTGTFTVVQYGASGFPPPRADGGANFFAGGPASPSSAQQSIDLRSARKAVDAGRVDVRVGGLVRTPPGGAAALVLVMLDSRRRSLSLRNIRGKAGSGAFERIAERLPIPPLARRLKIKMVARAPSTGYNDASFDNVSLKLAQRSTPRPERGKTILVKPSKGVVVLFRRGNRKVITHPVVAPVGTVVDASRGTATITSATDRFGSKTADGSFAEGVFSIHQVGSDTQISLGGDGPRVCSRPRRLVSRATGRFQVLAGASGSRPASVFDSGFAKAVWVAEDRCTATTVKSHAGRVDIVALGNRRVSGRRVQRLFAKRGRFQTRGRNSSATVRGRIIAR